MPIREYSLSKVLQGLGINFEEVYTSFLSIIQFEFSLRIYVYYSVVITVSRSKVLDKNVHWI
jgi:hypothetical protein